MKSKTTLRQPTKNLLYMLVVLCCGLASGRATADQLYPDVVPGPGYEPHEVVGIQMRALGQNDTPYENAGIDLTFRFASPGNRTNTGPIERFTALFDLPDYQPMLNHSELEIGPSTISNNTALVPVLIKALNGDRIAYLFRLSRQNREPYVNCWMTDSVVRMRLSDGSSSAI